MIHALLQGELIADPAARTASTGRAFWTGTLRVSAGTESLLVSVTAFDATAGERLMKLRKGSALAAAGTLEPTAWTGKDGAERKGWRLTAAEVLSVHQARKRREPAEASS